MQKPIEFQVDDQQFVAKPMDAFTQYDVLARVSPLFASGFGELAPFFIKMKEEGVDLDNLPVDRVASLLTPVTRELAKMSDADRRFIIAALLGTVERKQPSGEWAPVWNSQAGRSMFDDIQNDAGKMLRIAMAVFQRSFASFLPGSLSKSRGAANG